MKILSIYRNIVIVVCAFAATKAFALSWYASPTGKADAACTIDDPGTIQAAIDKASSGTTWEDGDTVLLLPGKYDFSSDEGIGTAGIHGNSCITILKDYLTVKSANDDPSSVVIFGRGGETYISEDLTITNVPHVVRAFSANATARVESLVVSNFYSTYAGVAFYSHRKLGLTVYNCDIVNNLGANSSPGHQIVADGCRFIANTNSNVGGALAYGYATNSIFISNTANSGGAIYSPEGDIGNCVFINNQSLTQAGGAIWYNVGGFHISDCIFSNNISKADGGAVNGHRYSNDNNLYRCRFFNNIAGGSGGAVYKCRAFDSFFSGNSSQNGGAARDNQSYNCIFSNNTATANGAAVYGGIHSGCVFVANYFLKGPYYGGLCAGGTFVRCEFRNNVIARNISYSGPKMENCLVVSNTITDSGYTIVNGGIFVNSTIAHNKTMDKAVVTGGTLTNTIVIANDALADIGGGTHVHTLYGTTTGSPIFDAGSIQVSSAGFRGDRYARPYSIKAGSPARDAGVAVPHFGFDTIDAYGMPRLYGTIDIGCSEFHPRHGAILQVR